MKRKGRQAYSSSFLLMVVGQRGSCRGLWSPSNRVVSFYCLHASAAHQTKAISFPNKWSSLWWVWSLKHFLGLCPPSGLYCEPGSIRFLSSPLAVSISCCQHISLKTVNLKHGLKCIFLTYYMTLYMRCLVFFHRIIKPRESDCIRGQWDDLRSRIYRSGVGWQPIIYSEAGGISS